MHYFFIFCTKCLFDIKKSVKDSGFIKVLNSFEQLHGFHFYRSITFLRFCICIDGCTLKTFHEIVLSQLQLDLLSLLNTDVIVFFRSQSCDLSRTAEMCRLISVSQDQVWCWISSQASTILLQFIVSTFKYWKFLLEYK